MIARGLRQPLVGLTLIGLAAAAPFVIGVNYFTTQATLFFIWATVVTQWNLVYGYSGIFSMAQMAIFAVGSYATAMIAFYLKWSLWLAMPLAAFVAVVASMVIGAACFRLRGPYVALLTLAISQVLYLIIVNDTDCFSDFSGCMPLFGGVRGIMRFGELGTQHWIGGHWRIAHYFLALTLLALAIVVTVAIARSPLGLAFRALRDNPDFARACGINRFASQLWVFALSAFFTGLAGAFYAAHFRVVGPTIFSFSLLLLLLAMMVVGGVGTIWGPLLGAALLMLADESLKEVQEWRDIGLGVILALFVIVLPGGIVGTVGDWLRQRDNVRQAHGGIPLRD